MTTQPSPAAIEAARKHSGRHDDNEWTCCEWYTYNDAGERNPCTCEYDSRLLALAAAFDEYAQGVLSNHWCEAHPIKPTLRHHQEDGE